MRFINKGEPTSFPKCGDGRGVSIPPLGEQLVELTNNGLSTVSPNEIRCKGLGRGFVHWESLETLEEFCLSERNTRCILEYGGAGVGSCPLFGYVDDTAQPLQPWWQVAHVGS